jgi:hypothetical protein
MFTGIGLVVNLNKGVAGLGFKKNGAGFFKSQFAERSLVKRPTQGTKEKTAGR